MSSPTEGRGGRVRIPWPATARGWVSMLPGLLVLAAIVVALWYFGVRDGGGEAPGVADGGAVSGEATARYGPLELPPGKNATGESPAGQKGRAAPDFLLERLDGPPLRLSDLQGRPVLVNFWATWCPPCRKEMPLLVQTYHENEDAGLVVVGVNLQEGDGPVGDFVEEYGVDFPVVMDRDGQVAESWRVGGPIGGLPASYFVDGSGVIREVFFGEMNEDVLAERLAVILPPGGGP